MVSNNHSTPLILIVNADKMLREAKRTTLINAGYQVTDASSGNSALAKARSDRPHLIILDSNLPDINGFDVCSQLKNDPETKTILILQTSVSPGQSLCGLDGGADNYLIEPIDADELLANVKLLLRLVNVDREVHAREQWDDNFLAKVVHDLRNPLAPLLNSVELLRMLDPNVPEMQEKARTTIKNQAQLIVRFVDDILDAAQRSREQFVLQKEKASITQHAIANVKTNFSDVPAPLQNQETAQAISAESISSADLYSSKRVLVVDDNVDVADTLAQWLRLAGHNVLTAYTGAQALDSAAQFKPDIILLDIGLPDASGFDIAKKLRALPDLQQFLLVAVTGYGQASLRQSVLEAGFDEHFAKPMNFEKLSSIGLHV